MGPLTFNSTVVGAQGNGAVLYDAETGGYNVFEQRTDPQGNLVGDPIEINTPSGGDAIAASVTEAPDGNMVAVYIGQGPEGGPGIYFRRINADGTLPDASETYVGPSAYWGQGMPGVLLPSVAIDPDDNFAIASAENGL
jgi:hypothetical protein